MRRALLSTIVIGLMLLTVTASWAAQPLTPFDGREGQWTQTPWLTITDGSGMRAAPDDAIIAGADYLQAMQADVTEDLAGNGYTGVDENPNDPDDAGWDWRVTSPPAPFHHTTAISPKNLYGATAQGLYYAYLATSDQDYFRAMNDAADYMVAVGDSIRSAADLILLMRFNGLPNVGGTTYQDGAKAKFDGRVAVYGSADSLAKYIRDVRGASYPNGIIAWDIGAWAVAAAMLGDLYPGDPYDYAAAADSIAEVIFQDSYMDNPGYFDLEDDAGWDETYENVNYWWYCLGVTGLMDAFRASGTHTDRLDDLVDRIEASTFASGAVSGSYGANTDDEDWQATAYAAASLAALDQETHQAALNLSATWLGDTQDASGGWLYDSGNHYPEIAGENTAALYFGLTNTIAPTPEVSCLTAPSTCNTVTFSLTRSNTDEARGASVKFQLSDNLELCVDMATSIVQGSWLSGFGLTSFQLIDEGGGAYTVDQAILGDDCGPTTGGTLFTVDVKRKTGEPDGVGTIMVTSIRVRDCDNAPIPHAPGPPAEITIDNTPPVTVTNLDATQVKADNDDDGTTQIELSFTEPGDAAQIYVYRAGFGNYPEYDDSPGSGSVPATPSYPPGAPWVLTGVTGSGEADEVAERDFWYYVVFTEDACGNVSAVSNKTNGTLNYYLGDVTDGLNPPESGDNFVGAVDISLLGAHYGITLSDPGPDSLAFLDVGPTTDYSIDARPITDNLIEFEDLLVFALNYGQETPIPRGIPVPVALGGASAGPIRLEIGPTASRVHAGQSVIVPLVLCGDAENVKGIRTIIHYDATQLAYETSDVASEIAGTTHFFKDLPSAGEVDLGLALLGSEAVLQGEGVVMTIRFRAIGSGDPGLYLSGSKVRDVSNKELLSQKHEIEVRLPDQSVRSGERPSAFRLHEVRPNPFTPRTTIFFDLPTVIPVTLTIHDAAGRLVRTLIDEIRPPGSHAIEWNCKDDNGHIVGSGVYFCTMTAGSFQSQKRMALLK